MIKQFGKFMSNIMFLMSIVACAWSDGLVL
jgi:hypothetical protein